MSWKQLGILWAAVFIIGGVAWSLMRSGGSSQSAPQRLADDPSFQAKMEQLKKDQAHPSVKAAFQAGFAFRKQHKATGLAKLSERELDAYAMAACQQLAVPVELRGLAVRKFKDGYGWGDW